MSVNPLLGSLPVVFIQDPGSLLVLPAFHLQPLLLHVFEPSLEQSFWGIQPFVIPFITFAPAPSTSPTPLAISPRPAPNICDINLINPITKSAPIIYSIIFNQLDFIQFTICVSIYYISHIINGYILKYFKI